MTLGYVITYAAILAAESEDLVRLAELLADADLLQRLSDRYLMVVLEALRGWLDVCEGSAGGIEKIVRSVARSRTEGETLHLTYTLLLLARARGMVGEFREGRAATREGSRGHTAATSVISRPSCGESTASWLIAAGKPKPLPLLCAVPSRPPALKGRAG